MIKNKLSETDGYKPTIGADSMKVTDWGSFDKKVVC